MITWTPGLSRSSHDLMRFAFPSRTAKTTTESVTIPLYDCRSHLASTSPALTSVSTSGAREKATMSAFSPAATALAWSPEAPYDCEKETPLPAAVAWNIGISFAYASLGVE